jgi:DNA-binding CsgD family transcriptional regulator
MLLERAGELERINAALAGVLTAEPSILIVEGAAGVGKTRLLRSTRERAERAGVRVLAARGGEFEREFAWGVARQLLASHAVIEAVSGMPGAARLARPVLEPRPALEPSASFAVLHGLYWVTANLAAAEPLALVVDDAHWLDEPSLRWLVFLATRLEGLGILVMLAARPGEVGQDAYWAELAVNADVLSLSPLSSTATRELIAARYGHVPADAFVQACWRATGGNPFLVTELVSRLLSEGIAADSSGAEQVECLPRSVISRGVTLRLRKLAPPERAVARAVAVLGDAADLRRTARLAGLDEGHAADAAGRLTAAQVFADQEGLQFLHPLVRSAAHADLPSVLRPRWHAAAARLLDADGFDIDQVAAQLIQAEPRGDPWAIERLRSAAAVAHARGAAEAAARYLERALREPPDPDERQALLLGLARAYAAISPAAGAVAFGEAVEGASDPRARAEAGLGLGLALTFSGRFVEAADALEAALADTGGSEPDVKADLEAALLNTLRWDIETRARSLPLVERLKTRAAQGELLDARLHANLALELLIDGEDLGATVHHAELALAEAELGAEGNAMWVPVLVTPLAAADRLDRAVATTEAVMTVARARGWRPIVAIATATRAKLRLWLGDVSGAAADAEDALANSDDVISTVLATAFMADSLLERGELDRAWEELDRRRLTGHLPAMWPFPWVLAVRGRLRCLRGDVAGGLDDLLGYGQLAERYGLRNPAIEPWRSDAALACLSRGQRTHALELATEELRLARVWGTPRPIGIALRALGLLEGGDRGVRMLRESEKLLAASPARLAHAASLTELGCALRRMGQRGEARDVLRRALHVSAECGAKRLAERARSEIVVAGGRPRRDAMRGRDALTPSELRIARLAADGLSNRQIAQALFITRRTVETHLTQVYRKLDVAAREQLASALA